jgi:hypothetical protein
MLCVENISYHACLNDCILYRGEYVDKEMCPKCGHERYHKSNKNGKSHGPPHEILRHMPIIPRTQALSLQIIIYVVGMEFLRKK